MCERGSESLEVCRNVKIQMSHCESRTPLLAGGRPVKSDILKEQPLLPKDERLVSVNHSPAAVIIGPSGDATEQPKSSDVSGERSTPHPLNLYSSHEGDIYGGYGSNTGAWDGYSPYNTDGMHVLSPVIYNDSPSLLFHSGYGFNHEIAYGQYSPVAGPLPSVMVDGQLYSTQQVPFSPSYYPQPSELMRPESSSTDNIGYGPGPGYMVNYRSFSGDLSGHLGSSPLASPTIYPPPMGILGSYEHNAGQISQQQRPMHGYGLVSSSFGGRYPQGSSYQSSNYGSASYSFGNDRNRLNVDKTRRRERDWDSISVNNNSHDIFNDRNRGPRASQMKAKSTSDQSSSSSVRKMDLSSSGFNLDSLNQLDFVTDYKDAKFFIIKSFSEDNIHKSIKYNVWASTPHGNKKLDAAYHEAKKIKCICPVFLFFSVNASGQFCGVAEMVGPVDFEKDADYWQQDRWSGQFPVQWHIVKDVPNIRFRHILLENNDNKPVTHSRDCQEVNLKQGIELLKIFNDFDARTSIIDDFEFYDEREKSLKERKVKQEASSTTDASDSVGIDHALQLKGSNGKEVAKTERDISSKTEAASAILEHDSSMDQISDSLSQVLQLEEGDKELALPSESSNDGEDSESVDRKATGV
ncbi:YTH domain-containing protein ECT3-like isoform X2 [Pyrus x bretschneideri]|uniref:YTH domain-containing protein ECT3-like isoform X2 n=1 Tax=Pyrus x bretschneideri TaxID=225117 RepID=UPI00202E1630|nr:YTH domain-containing protein ECT3-like isoform X2 [Pyrus x bretschneideri]XP_048427585.1 YTH domain-containing protein ECT3-like isoform X2 [Pyrus x bretschneideri]